MVLALCSSHVAHEADELRWRAQWPSGLPFAAFADPRQEVELSVLVIEHVLHPIIGIFFSFLNSSLSRNKMEWSSEEDVRMAPAHRDRRWQGPSRTCDPTLRVQHRLRSNWEELCTL
jgi:hypothetical protein